MIIDWIILVLGLLGIVYILYGDHVVFNKKEEKTISTKFIPPRVVIYDSSWFETEDKFEELMQNDYDRNTHITKKRNINCGVL